MNKDETLIEFPCQFPIKVIGNHTPQFFQDIVMLTRLHYPHTATDAFRVSSSHGHRYVSITVTVYAEDKATLDALYLDFTKHPDVKMVF